MKKVVVGLAAVAVMMLGYAVPASACHIENAVLTAVCTEDGGQYTVEYGLEVHTWPAGWEVEFNLFIVGPSGTETATGTFYADGFPYVGSVPVSGDGQHTIHGTVTLLNYYDLWNLAPISVECTGGGGTGDEGCTPGYWKNHLSSWPATGYDPDDDFDTVFGTEYFNPDITLYQAVNALGGDLNRLARHGASGLLNAAHPDVDYPLTLAEVIAAVQAGNADLLEWANELGCPLALNIARERYRPTPTSR